MKRRGAKQRIKKVHTQTPGTRPAVAVSAEPPIVPRELYSAHNSETVANSLLDRHYIKMSTEEVQGGGEQNRMSSLSRRACYKCGNVGHYAEVCSSSERLCYNCKQPGKSLVCGISRRLSANG